MKAAAIVTAALIFLLYTSSGFSYFNILTTPAKQSVFSYNSAYSESSTQMKPISQEALVKQKHSVALKLMTYNMHRGIGKDGKLDLDATADAIKASDAAIVALQEVERYSIRTGFKDQIKELSHKLDMNYAFGKSINILNGEYGNGLLSIYPIEEYKVYDLPTYSEQRTVLRTVVNIDGLRLAVYNTHLGLKEAERKEQMDFILQMTGEETLDYILMGDMNSKAAKLSEITAAMKDSAAGSRKQGQSTFEEEGIQERIDYIFVSPKVEVTGYDVIMSEASDHYPVVSEILIGRE